MPGQQFRPITFTTLSDLTTGAEQLILNTVFDEKYGHLKVKPKSQLLNNIRDNPELMTTYDCLNKAKSSPISPTQRMYAIVFNQNVPNPTEPQKIQLRTKLEELMQKLLQENERDTTGLRSELTRFIGTLPEPQAVEQDLVVPVPDEEDEKVDLQRAPSLLLQKTTAKIQPINDPGRRKPKGSVQQVKSLKVQTRKEGPTEEEIALAKARIVELTSKIIPEDQIQETAMELKKLNAFIESADVKKEMEKLSETNKIHRAIKAQKVVRGFLARKAEKTKKEILAQAQKKSQLNLSALSLPNATLHHYIGPFTGIGASDGINYTKVNPDFTRDNPKGVKELVESSEAAINDIIEAIKPEPHTIWNALLDNPNDKTLILKAQAQGIDIDKAIKAWVKRLSDTSEQGTIAFSKATCENIDTTFALLNKIKPDWHKELDTELGFIGRSYFIGKAFTANSGIITSQPNSTTRTKFLASIYDTVKVKPDSAPDSFMMLMGEDQSQVNVNAIIDKFKSKGSKDVTELTIPKNDQTSEIKKALKAAIELGVGNTVGFGQMQFNRIKQQISDSRILRGNCNVEALTKECLKEVFLKQLRSIDIQGLNIQDSLMKFHSDLKFIQDSTGSAEDLVKAHERILSMKDNPVYDILNVIQSKYKSFEHLETDDKKTVLDEVLTQYYQEITKKSDLSSVLSSMSSSAASKTDKEASLKLFQQAVTGDVIGGIYLNDLVHNASLSFLENSLKAKLSRLNDTTNDFSFLASEVVGSEITDPKIRKERTQALHRAVEELKILHESIDKDFKDYPASQGNENEAQNENFKTAKEAYTEHLKQTATDFETYFLNNIKNQCKGAEFLKLLTAYQTKKDSKTISGYATLAKELSDCSYIKDGGEYNTAAMNFLDENIIAHLEERFNGIFTKNFSIQSLITDIEALKAELHNAVLDVHRDKEKKLFDDALLKYQENLRTVKDLSANQIQKTILMYLSQTTSTDRLFYHTTDYIRDMAAHVCISPMDQSNRSNPPYNDLQMQTLKDGSFQALFKGHEDIINQYLTPNLTSLISGATSQVISNLLGMMKMLTDTERNKIRKSSEGLKANIIANIIGADNIDESFKADVQNMLSIAYPNDGDHKFKHGEKATKSGLVTSSHEFMDRIVNEVIKNDLQGHDTQKKKYYEELINVLNEPATKIKEEFKEHPTLLKVQALTRIFRESKPDFGIGLAARFRDSFLKDVERLEELAKILTTPNHFDKKYGVQLATREFIRDIQEWIGLRTRSLDNAITGIAKEISNSGSIDNSLRDAVMGKLTGKLTELAPTKKESMSNVDMLQTEEEVVGQDKIGFTSPQPPIIHSQRIKAEPEYSAEAMICRIALGRHLSTLNEDKVVEFMEKLIPQSAAAVTVRVGASQGSDAQFLLSEKQHNLYTECMDAYKNRPYFGKELVEAITKFFSDLIERIDLGKLSNFMPKLDLNHLGVLGSKYFRHSDSIDGSLDGDTASIDGSLDEEDSIHRDEADQTGLSRSRRGPFNV